MKTFLRILLAMLAAWSAIAPRLADAFPFLASPQPVVEYYNLQTGHYFMTIDVQEMATIDAGGAGPGWIRTGYAFDAYWSGPGPFYCGGYCGEDVTRFYGPQPNSHFYTVDPAEAALLDRPGTGWIKEGSAFSAGTPDAQGGCGTLVPVYRLYNNRFAFNDSNHRFVTSPEERARMIAKGWADEGVKLCAFGKSEDIAIKTFLLGADLRNGKMQPSAVCEDETRNLGGCMAFNNLLPPSGVLAMPVPSALQDPFIAATGAQSAETFIVPNLSRDAAATTVFVQSLGGFAFGIHVDTIQRGPAVLTSVNPLYQFKTTLDANGVDPRIFPFSRAYESDAQVLVKFTAKVKRLAVRNDVSHAFGHPTLELIDRKSGRHLYFTTLAFGTVLANDLIAPDLGTGKVIVGTTFRPGSRYMRNGGVEHFATPRDFRSEAIDGQGGTFAYRMDRAEFQRVLDDARTVDAALSADPEDYFFDNFHFNNEVYGDGEIGMNISDFSVSLVKR